MEHKKKELKQCPFCGERELLLFEKTESTGYGAIYCTQCECFGPRVNTEHGLSDGKGNMVWHKKAITEWNRRI